MAALQYRTRGMSNPQGKPRVYFCCHPEDHDNCFEQTASWVLGQSNCALWFGDGAPEDLAPMQLFIMPVTARLLNTEMPP